MGNASPLDKSMTLPKSLHDYAEARADVVGLLTHARKAIDDADALMRTIYTYGLPFDHMPHKSLAEAINAVDSILWRRAFDATGLRRLMDEEATKQFHASLDKAAPPFTIDNVRAEVIAMSNDADKMFSRGVYNVFRQLPEGYRTNDREPFKIGVKAILSYFFEHMYFRSDKLRVNYHKAALVNDLDRVFVTLDGGNHEPRALENAINHAMQDLPHVFENQYFHIKGFRNQNAHVKFLRPDLLDRVNVLIGEYCGGNALVDA